MFDGGRCGWTVDYCGDGGGGVVDPPLKWSMKWWMRMKSVHKH